MSRSRAVAKGIHIAREPRYRLLAGAVISLIFNVGFAFYHGILGILSSSLLFAASAVYYLLLSVMRFSAVMLHRSADAERERAAAARIGGLLIVLSGIFHIMVLFSIREHSAASYGLIPMLAIATFTFTKITMAAVTAVRYRKDASRLLRAIRAIRYSEVAVSLLTMQQSMLLSFGEADEPSEIILNACTGAGVCFFILALGILTLKNSRKDTLT